MCNNLGQWFGTVTITESKKDQKEVINPTKIPFFKITKLLPVNFLQNQPLS